jgi:hypothetical protein
MSATTSITTATFIRQLPNWRGDARLYRLSQPVRYTDSDATTYVVVSAVELPAVLSQRSDCETYIFPSDDEGEVLAWSELPGSTRGTLFHEVAIEEAGWVLR